MTSSLEREEELIQACRRGQTSTVKRILATCEISIDCRQKATGRTPLHFACRMGEVSCVQALLAAGADTNAVCGVGDSCLHHAVLGGKFGQESPTSSKIVALLLQAGANPNVGNAKLQLPLDVVQECDTKLREVLLAATGGKQERSSSTTQEPSNMTMSPVPPPAKIPSLPSVPRPLVPLSLPHPSIHAELCQQLWERCHEVPDSTARRAMALIDEVLSDVCMDNMESDEFDRVEESARAPLALHYLRCLAGSGVPVPGALLEEVERHSSLALAATQLPDAFKITEVGGQGLIKLLAQAIEWCTAGEILATSLKSESKRK